VKPKRKEILALIAGLAIGAIIFFRKKKRDDSGTSNPQMLSKNLSIADGIKSSTATRLGISNFPTNEHLANMRLTAQKVYEPLRAKVGELRVTSFYRSPAVNKAISGSATNSQHSLGQAMDIQAVSGNNRKLFEEAIKLPEFDQIIWEFGTNDNPAWVHVSYSKSKNRRSIIKGTKGSKGTIYTPYKK
jgi:hypothetical protein